jgi:hypothetical protein
MNESETHGLSEALDCESDEVTAGGPNRSG